MKHKVLIAFALTLGFLGSLPVQAQRAPALEVQTATLSQVAPSVLTLELSEITDEVSPEMRAVLEQVQTQALARVKAGWNVKSNTAARSSAAVTGRGKVSMQDFSLTASVRSGITVQPLRGGGYEVHNPATGERIKISISVRFKPLTVTVSAEW